MSAAATEISKEAVRELKSTSPKWTGEYGKSWMSTKTHSGGEVIYNKNHYRLTYLLEHGHAKRRGGRVQAYPHIKKVEEKAVNEFIEKVEKAASEG